MEREVLRRYLDDGLSLIEIGALEAKSPSTVGYWVRKHGLTANGSAKYAPKGGLAKAELEALVEEGLTLKAIGERLGMSTSTVAYWLRRCGLKTARHRKENAAAFALAESSGELRTVARCRRHGATEFGRRPDSGWRCLKCRSLHVANYRRRAKDRLVSEGGGRCRLCGYDRYQGALQFHHLDPSSKQFELSRRGITRNLDERRREAAKCVLLCANCHAEVEAGVAALT